MIKKIEKVLLEEIKRTFYDYQTDWKITSRFEEQDGNEYYFTVICKNIFYDFETWINYKIDYNYTFLEEYEIYMEMGEDCWHLVSSSNIWKTIAIDAMNDLKFGVKSK